MPRSCSRGVPTAHIPFAFPSDFGLLISNSNWNNELLMQFVRDIYAAKAAAGKPVISFEFFPPKTEEGDRTLLEKTLPALMQAKPDYCSVTYGAGGSTRD